MKSYQVQETIYDACSVYQWHYIICAVEKAAWTQRNDQVQRHWIKCKFFLRFSSYTLVLIMIKKATYRLLYLFKFVNKWLSLPVGLVFVNIRLRHLLVKTTNRKLRLTICTVIPAVPGHAVLNILNHNLNLWIC